MEITIVMSFGPVVEIKNGKNLQKEKRIGAGDGNRTHVSILFLKIQYFN